MQNTIQFFKEHWTVFSLNTTTALANIGET